MSKKLLSGYTTGTHTTAVIGAILTEYFLYEKLKFLNINLPKSSLYAKIKIKREEKYHFSTIKVDNDDLDVTKGCCIRAKLFLEIPKNLKKQKPSSIKIKKSHIFIYGGDGIGIVTKAGLKIQPNYPAINPIPLKMIKNIATGIIKKDFLKTLHIVVSVDNGEKIAKKTANEKVGVIGGLSILGTRGIVKPISADVYLDSIKTEICVADASYLNEIVFTLGNTAFEYANNNYKINQVIEIGNFIYDASKRLKNTKFKKIIFISSIAKMCKIAQGCKNTHNRFGGIDFSKVKAWLKKELDINLGSEKYLTLKAVLQKLSDKQIKQFSSFLGYKAANNFKKWFLELGVDINNIETITLNDNETSKRKLIW